MCRYCRANVLELTEISLDDKLTDNAVDIVLTEHIVPSSIVSCDYDDVVMVTFVTTALIYWIQLPHPLAIIDKVTITIITVLKCWNIGATSSYHVETAIDYFGLVSLNISPRLHVSTARCGTIKTVK